MADKRKSQANQGQKTAAEAREDRLKKALKANMARRKAQARARAANASDEQKDEEA